MNHENQSCKKEAQESTTKFRQRILEQAGFDIKGHDEDQPLFLTEDFYDDAVVGIALSCAGTERRRQVVYDYGKLIEITSRENKWTDEESIEWHDYNTLDAWVGEGTPIFIQLIERA